MDETIKRPVSGEDMLTADGKPLSIGSSVTWKPGPRATRNVNGTVQSYAHPFLSVNCKDGKVRKIRPGAVTLVS